MAARRSINNPSDDRQVEVAHARRVMIDGNKLNRAIETAGIFLRTEYGTN
jgi:hypothetical protein